MQDSTTAFNPHESSYRWVIMALAATSFILAFVSRFAWPPLIPVVMPIMDISRTEALAYMSAFYIGYVATQIPSGILADRFGPRLVLSSALMLQGLGTLGIGLTDSYQVGFALRVVCGLGAGCVYSSCLKSVVTWFTPTQRAMAIGVVMTAPTIGIAIPNFIMPMLNESMGWQAAFRSIGWAIVVLSIILLVFMKDIKTTAAGPRKSFMVGLKYVCSNRNILLISLTGFCSVWCQIGFGSMANPYMVNELGFTVPEAGRVMMIYGLVGIVMPTIAGMLCAKYPDKKKMMVIVCHVAMMIAFLAFGMMSGAVAVLLVACVIGLLMAYANPVYSVIIAENAGPEWTATAGGVGNAIFQIGALLSPIVIGMAADSSGSYGWTWWILAGGAIVGAVFATLLVQRTTE